MAIITPKNVGILYTIIFAFMSWSIRDTEGHDTS